MLLVERYIKQFSMEIEEDLQVSGMSPWAQKSAQGGVVG